MKTLVLSLAAAALLWSACSPAQVLVPFTPDVPVSTVNPKSPGATRPPAAHQPPASIAPQKGTRVESKPQVATNWVVPPERQIQYDGLELTIISGTPQRRLATINNCAFLAGENLRVSVNNKKILVRCLEIRERSVIVQLEGEDKPRELRLPAWR